MWLDRDLLSQRNTETQATKLIKEKLKKQKRFKLPDSWIYFCKNQKTPNKTTTTPQIQTNQAKKPQPRNQQGQRQMTQTEWDEFWCGLLLKVERQTYVT